MADQGLWWKLWCSSLDDGDLDNLDITDFGRYCKLGAYIKKHGTSGTVVISPPSRSLCAMFQVDDFECLIMAFHRLPNVHVRREKSPVSSETVSTVTYSNWAKYQGDYSTQRVRNFRDRKRARGEEKRGEEKEKRRESVKTLFPPAFGISERVKTWAQEKGYSHLEKHLEVFKSKCLKHGYKYVNWEEAFMEAIRDNWAEVSNGIGKGVKEMPRPKPPEDPIDPNDISKLVKDATKGM